MRGKGGLNNVRQTLIPIAADGEDYDTIVWGPLFLQSGGTFKGRIRNVRITDQTGVYNWQASLGFSPDVRAPDLDDDNLLTLKMQLHVLQAESNPIDPDVTFQITEAKALPLSTAGARADAEAGIGGFNLYDAAGRYRLTFKFTAERTPIRNGKVWFTLPNGWSKPEKDAGKLGYTKFSYTKDPDLNSTRPDALTPELAVSGQKITISKLDLDRVDNDITDAPSEITITYGEKNNPADAVDDDMLGALAQKAAGAAKIESRFDVDGDGPISRKTGRASNEINLTVGNVAAGSGKATIGPDSVEAGSIVSLTVVYTAAGTMTDGQVALQMPADWGDLQQTEADEDNYVQVTSSGGTLGDWDTNDDTVEVNLGAFDEGDRVRFALSNVVAQPSNLGVVNFLIYSAGNAGESLELVVGEEPRDGAYTNTGANLELLLGRVYRTDCIDDSSTAGVREDYNGFLRVAVTGGGDGGGTATVEIVASENSGDYDYVDGTATLTGINQLHAGDGAKTHLQFTYTPIETIIDGELKFTVPSGWADPQTDSPSTTGFTQVSSGGRIGSADATEVGSVTVPIYLINKNDTITIDYGSEAAVLLHHPTSMGTETFTIAVKGSADGRLKPIGRQPIGGYQTASNR